MRASRSFVPASLVALEGRLVLSAVTPVAVHATEVRPVHLSSAEIAQSNASNTGFGLSVSDSLRAGFSVAEQVTTRYGDGSTQTESLVKVPDTANNTVTTYETINRRNNGGTEKVVDTESFSGGNQPLQGTDNTHNLTITLPNGTTETETYHEVITGPKTVVTGTIHEAGGGVDTWTSVKIRKGLTTTANKVTTEADGSVERQQIVTTRQGDLDSTTMTSTTLPDGSHVRSSSATDVTRVPGPSN